MPTGCCERISVVRQETKAKLMECLPCTGLPPHFYMTVDKATVNKRSNQAVIICPILDGKRVVIAVAAPEVNKGSDDGSVKGGTLRESGIQALTILEEIYGQEVVGSLIGKCCLKI